jgi:hypothetical protein
MREFGSANRFPANRRHVGSNELHRVVDRETCGDRSARRVDIKINVLLGIFGFKKKQLRDDQVRNLIVDRRAEKNDVVFEKPGVDIKRALATRRLLDDHWYQSHIRFQISNLRSQKIQEAVSSRQ